MKRSKGMICMLATLFFAAVCLAVVVNTVHAGTPQTRCPVLGNAID